MIKENLTIIYRSPFYYLVEKKKFLWIFNYYNTWDFSHTLEEVEEKYKYFTT